MKQQQFDRWALVVAVLVFGFIAVYGMRIGNSHIEGFGTTNFTLFSGGFLALLNRDLNSGGNGNGNGSNKGSGIENPTG